MRGSGITLFLAFGSICAAQTGSMPVTLATATALAPGNCPIDIEARQQPRNPYLLADTGTARAVHPSYQVTFHARGEHAIQQVVVALSGPSGLHLRNATVSNAADGADAVETFTLTGSGDATLTTKKLTAVERLNLVSVTYADGSQWHRSKTNVCVVSPNGFVPVQ